MARPSKSKLTVAELGADQLSTFNAMLKEAVASKAIIQSQKDQLSAIRERSNEELGLSPAEFNKYANIAWESHKAIEQLEKAQEVYDQAVRLRLIEAE